VAAPQLGHLVADTGDARVRAEPRLCARLGPGLCLLCDDGTSAPTRADALLYGFDAGGQDESVLRIGRPSAPGLWHIDDAVLLSDGAILAESIDQASSLRRVDAQGQTGWEHHGRRAADAAGAVQLAGASDAFLLDGAGNVYVAAGAPQGTIASLDPQTGALRPYGAGQAWSGRAFMDSAGRLYSVRYDPSARKRLWVRVDRESGREETTTADDASYPFLAETIGVDDNGRAYGVAWPEIACIDPSGAVAWRLALDAIGLPGRAQWLRTWRVVPDGTVLIPVQTATHLIVSALVVR
jgi:hypothetical protein